MLMAGQKCVAETWSRMSSCVTARQSRCEPGPRPDSDEFAASDRGSDSESESALDSVARRAEAAMTPRHGISLAAGNLSGRRLGVSTGA